MKCSRKTAHLEVPRMDLSTALFVLWRHVSDCQDSVPNYIPDEDDVALVLYHRIHILLCSPSLRIFQAAGDRLCAEYMRGDFDAPKPKL